MTPDLLTLPVVTSGTSCISSGLLSGYGDCLSVPTFWPWLGIPRLFPNLWPSRINLSLLILPPADLSVGYIPSNWITSSLRGGKEDLAVKTDNQWRLIKEMPGSSLFVLSLVLGGRWRWRRCCWWYRHDVLHLWCWLRRRLKTLVEKHVKYKCSWIFRHLDIYFYSAIMLWCHFRQFTTAGRWKQPNCSAEELWRRKRKAKAKLFIAGRTFVALMMLWWNKNSCYFAVFGWCRVQPPQTFAGPSCLPCLFCVSCLSAAVQQSSVNTVYKI